MMMSKGSEGTDITLLLWRFSSRDETKSMKRELRYSVFNRVLLGQTAKSEPLITCFPKVLLMLPFYLFLRLLNFHFRKDFSSKMMYSFLFLLTVLTYTAGCSHLYSVSLNIR